MTNNDYTKLQCESTKMIEDKLQARDLTLEMPSLDRIYKKDYIAQVKSHIKDIITTGKTNIPTLSKFLHQEKAFQGKQANL